MKTTVLILCMAASLTSFAAVRKASTDSTICYKVSMDCMSCKQKIEKNIAFEKGVKALDVNLTDKTVTVKFNAAKNTSVNIKNAIEKLHYKAEVISAK
jgi:copper chaperone CopZ